MRPDTEAWRPTPVPVPADVRAAIAELYLAGVKVAEIPAVVGRQPGTVLTVLHRLKQSGIIAPRYNTAPRVPPIGHDPLLAQQRAAFKAEIVRRHNAGETNTGIAAALGSTRKAVGHAIARMRKAGMVT